MGFEENEKLLQTINTELHFQRLNAIWKNFDPNKKAIEYAVLMRQEIHEAIIGYCTNDYNSNHGRNRTEHEILQTVCLGIEFLSKLGDDRLQMMIDSTIAKLKEESEKIGGGK